MSQQSQGAPWGAMKFALIGIIALLGECGVAGAGKWQCDGTQGEDAPWPRCDWLSGSFPLCAQLTHPLIAHSLLAVQKESSLTVLSCRWPLCWGPGPAALIDLVPCCLGASFLFAHTQDFSANDFGIW